MRKKLQKRRRKSEGAKDARNTKQRRVIVQEGDFLVSDKHGGKVGQVVNWAKKRGFPAEPFQKGKLAQKLSVTPYRRS